MIRMIPVVFYHSQELRYLNLLRLFMDRKFCDHTNVFSDNISKKHVWRYPRIKILHCVVVSLPVPEFTRS